MVEHNYATHQMVMQVWRGTPNGDARRMGTPPMGTRGGLYRNGVLFYWLNVCGVETIEKP